MMVPLCYAAKLDPFLSLDCARFCYLATLAPLRARKQFWCAISREPDKLRRREESFLDEVTMDFVSHNRRLERNS